MSTKLRVLIVEDSESDAGLMARRLEKAGYDLAYQRVETAEEMQTALTQQEWDLIVADYNLPTFSGPAALEIFKKSDLDIPFIVVSAAIGEDRAVAMMKAGAHDYVMKDNLARLVPAVERELREAEGRRQRRRAEYELVKSEATLRTVLKGSSSGIGLVVHRVFQWVNDQLLHLTGYSREELIGQKSRMLYFSEAEYKRVGHVTGTQIQANGWAEVETQWRRKDGSLMEIYVNTSSVESGNPSAGVVFTAMDITERKRAEKELQQREQQYRLLVNNIPGIVFKGYADYTVEFFDNKIETFTGYPKEEFNDKRLKWSKLIIPQDLQDARGIFHQALKGDRNYIREYRIKKQGGEIVWIQERGQIVEGPDGKIDHISGIFFDITLSRRMQTERDHLFDLSLDMLCIAGFDGYFKQLNPAWIKTLGWSKPELLSKPWLEFVHPEDRDATIAVGKQLIFGKPIFSFENRYLCRDGSYHWLSWNTIPLLQEGLIFGVARDVTAHKQAEKELKLKEKLLDSASDSIFLHDLEGNLLYVNEAAYITRWYGKEEILKLGAWSLATPEAAVHQDSILKELWGNGELIFESEHRRKDGSVIPVEIVARVLSVEDRELILSEVRDITERKRAEVALRCAAQKWRTTFDAIGDAICLVDRDLKITQCNQAMLNLSGLSFPEIIGGTCCIPFRNLTEPAKDCPCLHMKTSRRRETLTFSMGGRWLYAVGDPIVDEMGEFAGGAYIISDITTAKQNEEALRRTRDYLENLINYANAPIIVWDPSFKISQFNRAFEHLTGYEANEVTGQQLNLLFPEASREESLNKIAGTLSGERWDSVEIPILCKSGDIRIALWNSANIYAEDGTTLIATIAQGQDITDRKRAEAEVLLGRDKLHAALQGTVIALASTVETRDPYTSGHQRRVAQLSCAIARELGWPKERIEGLQVMSFLHDLGKIAVPAEILSRPGKLSMIEFSLIKSHPQVGYDILKDIAFPWPVAQAVLQHHERLDGSGYPQGLTDPDIMPEARILAVVDVVEAMASHRPYRPALGVDKALEEIIKNQGKLYDPQIVEVCVNLLKEDGFAFD